MNKIHNKFFQKYSLYRKWHQHPRHKHWHWGGLIVVSLFFSMAVFSSYIQGIAYIDTISSLIFPAPKVYAQQLGQNLRFPGATFEQRRQNYLSRAISYWGPACDGTKYSDATNQCIWALLENNSNGQYTSVIEGYINNYLVCSLSGKCEKSDHAVMVIATRMLLQYGDQISQSSKDKILNEIIGNGNEALKTGCTSNMRFNDYVAYYLLTQDPAYSGKTITYKSICNGTSFTYNGKTYRWGSTYNANELTRDWIQYMMENMLDRTPDADGTPGFELRSNTYGYSYTEALITLYDFADRPGVTASSNGALLKRKAKMMLDFLLLEWGVNTGPAKVIAGTAARNYPSRQFIAFSSFPTDVYWPWASPRSSTQHHYDYFVSGYRLPDVVYDVTEISEEPDNYWHEVFSRNKGYHRSGDTYAKSTPGEYSFVTKYYNLGGSMTNRGLVLNINSQDPGDPLGRPMERVGLPFRLWLGEKATVGGKTGDDVSYNIPNINLGDQRACQWRNAALTSGPYIAAMTPNWRDRWSTRRTNVCRYSSGSTCTKYYDPFWEVYDPQHKYDFDEHSDEGGWHFLREGKVGIAIKDDGGRPRNMEIVILGSQGDYPDFTSFKNAVKSNARVTRSSFTTSKGVTLANCNNAPDTGDKSLTVNGARKFTQKFDRLEVIDYQGNRLVDWNNGVMTVSKGGLTCTYDFNNWTYSGNGCGSAGGASGGADPISPTPVCGNNICETDKGENVDNCKADCGGYSANTPPTAFLSAVPSSGTIPLEVKFNASLSIADFDNPSSDKPCSATDPNLNVDCIKDYIWDFGDGNTTTTQSPTITYTYKAANTYTASVVVVDKFGAKDKATVTVTAQAKTPAPACKGGQSGQGGPQTPDIDSNGCVDEGDLSNMLSCWNKTATNAPSKCFVGGQGLQNGGASNGGGSGGVGNGGSVASSVCSDSIDNDQDGKTDYPEDPGCVSPDDNSEVDPVVGDKFNPPFPRIGQLTFYPIGQGAEIWKKHDNVNIRYYYPDMAREIKAKNPDVLLLAANDDLVRPCDDPTYADEWYLKRADGTKIVAFGNDCYMNLTNVGPTPPSGKRFNQYIAEQLVNNTDWTVFDGMFFDFWASQVWNDPDLIDLDRDGSPDGRDYVNNQWVQGLQTLIDNIRALRDVPIIAHEADASSFYLNGKAYEFWTQSKATTRSYNLTTALDYLSKAKSPQIVYAGGFAKKNDYATFRADFASAQIAGAFFGHDEGTSAHRYTYLHDEYEGYLGFPISAPKEIRKGVWVRYFDEGVVIANISGTNQTVSSADLDGRTYWRFRGSQDPNVNDGSKFTSITFKPFDGIMMFTQPLTLITPIIIDNQPVNMTSIDQNPAVYTGNWTQVAWDDTKSNSAYSLGWGWSQWSEPYAITTQAGATAVYQPNIKVPGLYEVFEWHPSSSADNQGMACSNVQISIKSADGTVQKTINQQVNTGRWNSLGVYSFNQGTGGRVTITAPGGCTTISDAVKFEYRG